MRQTWEDFINENFVGADINRILGNVNWEEWLYKAELSPVALDFTTDLSIEATNLALEYIQLNGEGTPDSID